MPSIGWGEMLMLAVVAIVVVGPKELPRLMRVVGHWMGKARAAAREFQQAFDDLARESEVDEMRRKMDDLRSQSMFPDIEDEEDEEPVRPVRAKDGNGVRDPALEGEKHSDEDAPENGDDERSAEEPEPRPVPSH